MNPGLTMEKYRKIRALYDNLINYIGITDDENKLFIPEGDYTNESIIRGLCSSLQNSGRMINSIKFNDRSDKSNKNSISKALYNYNAEECVKKYNCWQALYEELLIQGINDNGKKRQNGEKQRITNWEKYAKGLYEGIHYLLDNNNKGFETIKALVKQSNDIQSITDKEINIITGISEKITGMGIALVCDWLKECGCVWLVKPDAHIKEVYRNLIEPHKEKVTEKEIIIDMFDYATLIKEKEDKYMTAYKLDKMIWLICTGDFYQYDKKISKDEFVSLLIVSNFVMSSF